MFLNTNSIKINNVYMGQYITEARYGYNKLWGSDTGRSLSGNWSGTLLGIFPKITLQFRRLTQAELETLASIFDASSQTLIYYDPVKKADTTITTYSNDWEVLNRNMAQNEGFPVAFISTTKRS